MAQQLDNTEILKNWASAEEKARQREEAKKLLAKLKRKEREFKEKQTLHMIKLPNGSQITANTRDELKRYSETIQKQERQ